MKQNLINEGLEELKRSLLLMNYDLNKTSTENRLNEAPLLGDTLKGLEDAKMFGKELSASAIKDIEGAIKDAAPEMRELKLTDGRTLNPKSANFSNELKDAIKDGTLQGTELGYARLKILAKTKNPELVNAITKEIGNSSSIKSYLTQAEKDGKDLVTALGEYKTKGIQDLSREEKELIVRYFQESKAGNAVKAGETVAKDVAKTTEEELNAGKGIEGAKAKGYVATDAKSVEESSKSVEDGLQKSGVEASRIKKITDRLKKISPTNWNLIKGAASKLNWKTLLKYGLIAASVYGAYKWIFGSDKDMPPPPCIGGNKNFRASVDDKGNIVWVLISNEKYPKGVLMNMDNTCEDRATGRKGKWSCSETATEPTVTKESVDEIFERFSFLLQEQSETYGNVTIDWSSDSSDQNNGGGGTTKTDTSLPIPEELKDSEGVRKFQTWMETNHKGWYKGNTPIDGIFGPQTKAAWDKYKDEYLKSSGTTTTTTTATTSSTSGTTVPQAAPANVQNTVDTLSKDQQAIIDRYIQKGYKDLGMGKRIAPDLAPTYTEFNLKSQLGTQKDYFVYLKNTDVVPQTVEKLAQGSIKEEKITRPSCRQAIKTFYLSYDTGIELDDETFNLLKTKVQRCRKQYDDFNDLNITNNKLSKLYNLSPDNKYYISDKRNMGENNSTPKLKSLIRENLMKAKQNNSKKLLSESKIIKTRYSILVEGKRLKTASDFRKLSNEIINETIYLRSQNFNDKLINEGLLNFFLGLPYGESITEYFKEQFLKWVAGKFGIETGSFWFGVLDKAFGNVDLKDYPKLLECSFLSTAITDAFAEQGIAEIEKRTVGTSPIADISRNMMMELFKSSDIHKTIEGGVKKYVCGSLSGVQSKMTSLLGKLSDKVAAPTTTAASTTTAPSNPATT